MLRLSSAIEIKYSLHTEILGVSNENITVSYTSGDNLHWGRLDNLKPHIISVTRYGHALYIFVEKKVHPSVYFDIILNERNFKNNTVITMDLPNYVYSPFCTWEVEVWYQSTTNQMRYHVIIKDPCTTFYFPNTSGGDMTRKFTIVIKS